MRNNYENRIRASGWISALLHLLIFLLAWWSVPAIQFGIAKQPSDTITVTLMPPAPEPPAERPLERQLIDVATPATAPVQPTDLIAVQNTNASDTAASEGDKPGPKVDVEDRIDSLGGRAGALSMPQAPTPAEKESPEKKEEDPSEKKPDDNRIEAEVTSEASESATKKAPKPVAMAKAGPVTPAPPPSAPSPAAAPATPPTPPGNNRPDDAQTRGRRYKGVRNVGVQGFEALQDQIAPYLKKVEDAVERRWREALLTRYNGTRATEAKIDCEIGPDGRIVSLKISGTPDDRIYAAICKEAIEKAGPFGPFPFTVPEIYRNRNLEIRWSFNFS